MATILLGASACIFIAVGLVVYQLTQQDLLDRLKTQAEGFVEFTKRLQKTA